MMSRRLTNNFSGVFFSILALLVCCMATSLASADTIKIVTEELPPYNFTENGKLTGFSTEVVEAVLDEIKVKGNFQSMPWARAYETALNSPDILIYSIARTKERESLFKWVGVITPADWFLFSLKSNNLKIANLEDVKKSQTATVNEDVGEQYLLGKGFVKGQNIQSNSNYEINYRKLKLGRVDFWIMNELAANFVVRKYGDVPEQILRKSYHIENFVQDGFYMAFSLKTSDTFVEKFKQGLESIKKNGKYEAIRKKWL
ncbi:substrate-binding periplasmic protein [Undibacterium sp. Ji67W]|uniref:substrate-binding periplasmic protein n=1 Tax=Undibacterium sp. Ji67W TaxID=3413042 RepID=UPI003BF034EC